MAHGGGEVEYAMVKVEVTRSLKPREKEAGRMEKTCVWKARV